MTYDWTVLAEKGVLKHLSLVMKPVFGANHRWAMARGEESLRLELARRRAAGDPIVSAAIPPPPGPTFPHNLRRRGSRTRPTSGTGQPPGGEAAAPGEKAFDLIRR